MESGVGNKRKPLYPQPKRLAISGATKLQSRVNPTSDKGDNLIACSYTNISKEYNMDSRREFIRL